MLQNDINYELLLLLFHLSVAYFSPLIFASSLSATSSGDQHSPLTSSGGKFSPRAVQEVGEQESAAGAGAVRGNHPSPRVEAGL